MGSFMCSDCVAVVDLKKHINCAYETLGRTYQASFEGVQLELHLPQSKDSNEPKHGDELVEPAIFSGRRTCHNQPWGIAGIAFDEDASPGDVATGKYQGNHYCYANVKRVCLTPIAQGECQKELADLIERFVGKLIDHAWIVANHYLDESSVDQGCSIELISESKASLNYGGISHNFSIANCGNYVSHHQLNEILCKIRLGQSQNDKFLYLSKSLEDIYKKNYRSAVLHAALAVEVSLLDFLMEYFTRSCSIDFAWLLLDRMKPTLGKLVSYFVSITSDKHEKYKKISESRNKAAHRNNEIDRARATEAIKLASEFIKLDLSGYLPGAAQP
jgi:hypothetical protein